MKVIVNKCLDRYSATIYGDDGKFTGKGTYFTNSEEARKFKTDVESGNPPAWVLGKSDITINEEAPTPSPLSEQALSEPEQVLPEQASPEQASPKQVSPEQTHEENGEQLELSDYMSDIWQDEERV